VGTNWIYEGNLKDRRLQSITNTGAARGYQYITMPENVITAITETGGNSWTYGYDAADRLLTAQSAATTQYAYAYDPAGNLTTIQNPGATNTLTPNGLNQIGSLNSTAFSYDANGNLVHDDQHTYQWDAETRLVGIGYNAQPSKQTTMRYDGLGRRTAIITTDGGAVSETRHLWCGKTLCQARDANDAVTRRYFGEGEEILGTGELLYYSRDHLGSVRDLLFAQSGNVVASYDYDPYGNVTQAAGTASSDHRYAGMFYHENSGLYLTHFRVYDPRTSRWLSREPIGESNEINLYAYVGDNPILWIDSTGGVPLSTSSTTASSTSALALFPETLPDFLRDPLTDPKHNPLTDPSPAPSDRSPDFETWCMNNSFLCSCVKSIGAEAFDILLRNKPDP